MAFLIHPHDIIIIFTLIVSLISFYIYYYNRLKTWKTTSIPTNWPLLGMTPSLFLNFHRFHDYFTNILIQNGGTFIYKGPWFANMDILITSDPANFRYISATNFHNYPKGPEFREIFDILGDGIFNSDSELWELHRKTTMSLINDTEFLKLLEKTTWNNMEGKLIPVLEFMSQDEHESKSVDLEEIFQRFTFNSILSLLVGYDVENLPLDLPFNEFEAVFSMSEEALFMRTFLPKWVWRLRRKLQIGNEKHLTLAYKLSDEIFYKFIKQTYKVDHALLTGFMREYKDQNGSLGNHEKFIKDTLLNLLVAGRDTTSSALTWFFYLLVKNPIAKAKIREEIQAHNLGMMKSKDSEKLKTFDAKELEKLVYLHGALCEALRLFPPVPTNHKVPPDDDTLPSGHRVRKNCAVLMHSYTMGRMETIWGQDCLRFKPERWLSERGEIKHVPSYKFTAFHSGPRACLGKKISFIQMKIVAVSIINNYELELVDGHQITHTPSALLQMKHGLMVKVKRRIETTEVNLLPDSC